MLQLPFIEILIFIIVAALFLFCSVLAVIQLFRTSDRYRAMIISLIALGVSLESLILVLRAVEIQGVPLTGLFESMIVLSIAFGLTFLFLSITIHHPWFSSVMVWFMFFITLLSALVASPASEVEMLATTPWILMHGLSMVLSGASIIFSGCMAGLFLLARRNLKLKRIKSVIGKIPNIQKLESLNVLGIKAAFVFISFGLISGIGLAIVKSADISISFMDWITDSKIILVVVAWVLLLILLILRHFVLRARGVAIITLITCFLIVFSIIGANIFCGTEHEFSGSQSDQVITEGRQ